MTSSIIRRAACTVVLLSAGVPLLAQSGTANGNIRGVVHDPSGAAVARASIRAHNRQTGYERKAMSDDLGGFELPLLPVGAYDVQVTAPGFASFEQRGVMVELARASDLTVRL